MKNSGKNYLLVYDIPDNDKNERALVSWEQDSSIKTEAIIAKRNWENSSKLKNEQPKHHKKINE